jgi:hypothetical protein
MNRTDPALECACCSERPATKRMPDGRLFCGGCAHKSPERGARRPDRRSTLDAWIDFKLMLARMG